MYQEILAHQARIAQLRAEAEQQRLINTVRRQRKDTARQESLAARLRERWTKAA
ncbi:hypothetical protein JJV70_05575 [Streptomyces sp. JJ66]|uniref:hypothetical protein n=1 Tax=Streptomyces sp. JJ66 TaxID=2803843 RepID=UPI001C57A6CF|nr:hypothetical protein [Streptomyces sp. JJ66]MBW1601587.1 hypothetical protein [Streptomyces sp. JJ66]